MNVLCRHGYHLFPYERIRARCTSGRCSQVRDTEGRRGPRRLLPDREDLWAKGRPGQRLDLEKRCPYCLEEGRLVPACPVCWEILDREAGQVDDAMIAVLGARQAGKSHFFAALLHLLLEEEVGGEVWRVEIDRAVHREAKRRLLDPLFEDLEELPATPLGSPLELKLILENRLDGRRVLLVFQDLAGEVMASRERLAKVDFLRHASGVVLLADPLAFAPPASGPRRPWHHDEPDCVAILDLYREVVEAAPRRPGSEELPLLPSQKSLAVAVTKADLVLGKGHEFWSRETDGHLASGFWSARAAESDVARAWLAEQLPDRRLFAETAELFDDVSYFFVSSYGYRHKPRTEKLRKPPEPLRVHEPIFALLDRLTAPPLPDAAPEGERRSTSRGARRRSAVPPSPRRREERRSPVTVSDDDVL